MRARILAQFSAVVIVATLGVPVAAQRGRGTEAGPQRGQANAPFDMTGYWVSVITQDWRYRMVVPPKGDYMGVPMLPAAKTVADAWDPAKDEAAGEQCRGYGAAGIMRQAERLHITWQDPDTLRMDIDAGTQTRLFHFGDWKAPAGPATWQGNSAASWFARRVLAQPSTPKARSLRVVTTNLRPGYLRKNGIPYSAQTTLTEYFDVIQEDKDSTILVVTIDVNDPVYLENHLIVAAHFEKEPDGSKWKPTPCSSKW